MSYMAGQKSIKYDLSDYPKDNQYHDDTNKKVIDKFKDECNSTPIAEFIGLRSKMYSIEKSDLSNILQAREVVGTVVKKDLTHELYVRSLQDRKQMTYTQVVIRSHEHQIDVYEQNKISLSPLNTKRWISPDGVTTLAYGYYRIP